MSAIGSSTRRFQRAFPLNASIAFFVISFPFLLRACSHQARHQRSFQAHAISANLKCAFFAHLIQRFSSPSSFPSPLLSPSSSPFLFLFFRVDRALKRQHPLSCPSALAPIEVPYQRPSQVPSPLISFSASARLLPSLPLSLPLSFFLSRFFMSISHSEGNTSSGLDDSFHWQTTGAAKSINAFDAPTKRRGRYGSVNHLIYYMKYHTTSFLILLLNGCCVHAGGPHFPSPRSPYLFELSKLQLCRGCQCVLDSSGLVT